MCSYRKNQICGKEETDVFILNMIKEELRNKHGLSVYEPAVEANTALA